MNKTVVSVGIAALLIGLGGGYAGATAFAKTASRGGTQMSRGDIRGNFQVAGMRGNQAMGGFLSGTVKKLDDGSLTLDTRDGSSHVVLINPGTSVSKSVTGTLSDLTVGSTVIVNGKTNPDGSVSASLIQLRPEGTQYPMGIGGRAIPTPTPNAQ